MISSFEDILYGNWDFVNICNNSFLDKVVYPMVVWGIAFLVDYIYTLMKYDPKKQRERKLCKISVYSCIVFALAGIVTAIKIDNSVWLQWLVFADFMTILLIMKTISLYAIEPIKGSSRKTHRMQGV